VDYTTTDLELHALADGLHIVRLQECHSNANFCESTIGVQGMEKDVVKQLLMVNRIRLQEEELERFKKNRLCPVHA